MKKNSEIEVFEYKEKYKIMANVWLIVWITTKSVKIKAIKLKDYKNREWERYGVWRREISFTTMIIKHLYFTKKKMEVWNCQIGNG